MLAGAEAQAGIENDDRLIFARTLFAPARLDEQRAADFLRMKMPLPRFRPVLALHFGHGHLSAAEIQAKTFNLFQPGKNFYSDGRRQHFLAENTDAARLGFEVKISGSRHTEPRGEQFADGILGLAASAYFD